jgi:hypothetical protein
MKMISCSFHLFRFQILPTVTEDGFQTDFITGISTREELISKKNEIFANAVKEIKAYTHPRAELTHELYLDGDLMVIQLAANRFIYRITKELEEEQLDNWPFVFIVIDNDPSVQIMAVEIDPKAFYRTSTVVNILQAGINSKLRQYKLQVEITPLFLQSEFWTIVERYKFRIKRVEFFMVAPNLAQISKGLRLDLDNIKKNTNSINTNLTLISPKNEGLTLSKEDEFVQSLVEYSSLGGGTIHTKVVGIRKTIKTEDSVRSLEIDEICFTGDDAAEQLAKVTKELLKDLK